METIFVAALKEETPELLQAFLKDLSGVQSGSEAVKKAIHDFCEKRKIGMGKIMSAGTLLLAAGTRGKRKIMKNCRVMIHAVSAGSMGTIHNLQNEMEEIQNIQTKLNATEIGIIVHKHRPYLRRVGIG